MSLDSARTMHARPAGPAIVHFQQTHQGFWEPLVLVIGICEAYRITVGWANPQEKGAFTFADDYEPGKLGCAAATTARTRTYACTAVCTVRLCGVFSRPAA
jgi:hypothetical protein